MVIFGATSDCEHILLELFLHMTKIFPNGNISGLWTLLHFLNVIFQCSKHLMSSAARMLAVNVLHSHLYVSLATYHIDISTQWVIPSSHYMSMTWHSYLDVEEMMVELGDHATKPVNTVCSCVFTCASWTPHNCRPLCNFQPCLRHQNRYFKPKYDIS